MAKCNDCIHLVWDGECWDTGHIAYDSWYCNKHPYINENEKFPFKRTKCKDYKSRKTFWESEFVEDIDGSLESFKKARAAYLKKYKNE